MGLSFGHIENILLAEPASRARRTMGPVGDNVSGQTVNVTVIAAGASTGEWVYGPEVQAWEAPVPRYLPRGEAREDDRTYVRLEVTIDRSTLRSAGVGDRSTLVMADSPIARASVVVAPFLGAGAREGYDKLPPAYDAVPDLDEERWKARFDPVGIGRRPAEELRADGDLRAAEAIANARRDPYLTAQGKLRASIASYERWRVRFDLSPNQSASRWIGAVDADVEHARHGLAVIDAPIERFESVANDIALAVHLRVASHWEHLVLAGKRRIPGKARYAKVSERISGLFDGAVALAARQV